MPQCPHSNVLYLLLFHQQYNKSFSFFTSSFAKFSKVHNIFSPSPLGLPNTYASLQTQYGSVHSKEMNVILQQGESPDERGRLISHPVTYSKFRRNCRKQQQQMTPGFFSPNPLSLPDPTSFSHPLQRFRLSSLIQYYNIIITNIYNIQFIIIYYCLSVFAYVSFHLLSFVMP